MSGKRFSRTITDKISTKILSEIKPIDYHDRRNLMAESEAPNGLDQRLSFLGSQRFVPTKKIKEAVCVAKFANKE